jgi:hypothetical protein
VISGFSASIGSDVATAVMPDSCGGSSANGALVDAACLDPPYNVRIGGHAVAAGSHREFAMASGEMSEAEFRSFLADTLGAAARVSRDGAVHFVCMDWRHMTAARSLADFAKLVELFDAQKPGACRLDLDPLPL